MSVITALLVIFFGALTIWFRDPTFIEMKPTIIYLSFAISAIIIFVMMGGNLIRKDSKIPFGPYLAAGTLIALFTTTPYGGNYILNWYYTTMF